jgi:hypothetical protein
MNVIDKLLTRLQSDSKAFAELIRILADEGLDPETDVKVRHGAGGVVVAEHGGKHMRAVERVACLSRSSPLGRWIDENVGPDDFSRHAGADKLLMEIFEGGG